MELDFVHATPGWIACRRGAALDGTLAERCRAHGRRALLVCGTTLMRDGTIERIAAHLRGAGLEVAVHGGIPPEPSLDDCRGAIAAAAGRDCVIAVGGGSVLDVAKAAALAPLDTDPSVWFDGAASVPETGALPIVAIPTTAGTGSEATWVGVFTDRASGRKASFRGGAMMPSTVILDPLLTLTCSPRTSAWSGLDAFVQAVESATSVGANPLTDALSMAAAARIAHALPKVLENGGDIDAREEMLLASCMAGIALNTSRLGLVHGLAHPIGAATGAAHGLLCGMLMPAVARWNAAFVGDRYAELARAATGVANVESLARFVEDLLVRSGSPTRLRELDLPREALDRIARESLGSGSSKANPRTVDFAGATEVLERAW
ncbi:MAG: iron-containing alcohol dehydrogenase family protein [Armatimonadota bacterium]